MQTHRWTDEILRRLKMRRSYGKEFKINAVKFSYNSEQKITVLKKNLDK